MRDEWWEVLDKGEMEMGNGRAIIEDQIDQFLADSTKIRTEIRRTVALIILVAGALFVLLWSFGA